MCKATLLGTNTYYGGDISVDLNDLRRHLYILGKTGSGKSTLLYNMLFQWIHEGRGCGLIDPHGDLAEKILNIVPRERIDDVCYINPSDQDYTVSFNPLFNIPQSKHALVAQGIVRGLQGIWADSWGPRMENILRNALQAVMTTSGASFLGLQKMLSDEKYRVKIVSKVDDPMVKSFWVNEFGQWDKKTQREAVSPIQNKIGQFLNDPNIRNILCQNKSKVNISELMDTQKIVIVNLSKGVIGAESANLLGSLLVGFFGESAMGRSQRGNADIDFHLVIDEFHNFMTESFESMLSEVRKYALSLILTHQYGAQLDQGIRNAVIGNIGTFVTFTLGGFDAELFSKEYGHPWSVSRFTDLPPYTAVVKQLYGGVFLAPQYMNTHPPAKSNISYIKQIIARSSMRYGVKREIVDSKIRRWFDQL